MTRSSTQGGVRARRLLVHAARLAVLAVIVVTLRFRHRAAVAAAGRPALAAVDLERVREALPAAERLDPAPLTHGGRTVLSADGAPVGTLLQTSPESDRIVGFSGPTNVLIVFDTRDRIRGLQVLSSGDTREHVRQVVEHPEFLQALNGLSWEEAAAATDVDAVSGATLTSLAIREAVIHRLGGASALRFPKAVTLAEARRLFPAADRVEIDRRWSVLWNVFQEAAPLGSLLRTSPAADNVVGYQGPSDALIGFDLGGRVVGVLLKDSFDNDDYVAATQEDVYFRNLFNGRTLAELAALDLFEEQVEGVSGATMTSMAVAEGLVQAAQQFRDQREAGGAEAERVASGAATRWWRANWSSHDVGAVAVLAAGIALAFSRWRGKRWLRVAFQAALIGYLGLTVGSLVSQAMLVGWLQHGVPWRAAPGLVVLTAAALALPVTTRRNVYCSHICPHGAAQQLLARLPLRPRRPPRKWLRRAARLPALLLLWVVVVAGHPLPCSLIGIEPFDAYLFPVAGAATLAVAIVGLAASAVVPMAYCRYGCPTGALLDHVRYHRHSDRWTARDNWAAALAILAVWV